jgi:dienelactone hydrolase
MWPSAGAAQVMSFGLLVLTLCVSTTAVATPGDGYSPYGIGKTLYDEVLGRLERRHEAVQALENSSAGWAARQSFVRGKLGRLFAPRPPASRSRRPHCIERGIVPGDGFEIRKLLIETRDGYYAPAGLWVPNNVSARLPAVLFPSGHSKWAWREPGNQLIAYNLVRRGFAVLGYDPIGQGERGMDWDLEGNQQARARNGTERYGCSFEHEYLQRASTLAGVNAAALWNWDLTILVDYLASLDIVDPHRLGVAGCSGGGVQSAYIGASDERIVAASIACYTSTLKVDYAPSKGLPFIGGGGPAEGEQQWGPFVADGLDKPDLIEVRAPKPTQVLLTTRDQYFPLVGGEAALAESRPAFAALGGAGRLVSTVGNNTHGYINKTRQALYAFLSRTLLPSPPRPGADAGRELQPPTIYNFSALRVTSTGSVRRPPVLDGRDDRLTDTPARSTTDKTRRPHRARPPPYRRAQVISAPEINQGRGSLTAHESFSRPIVDAAVARLRSRRAAPHRAAFLESVRSSAAEVLGVNRSAAAVLPGVAVLDSGMADRMSGGAI